MKTIYKRRGRKPHYSSNGEPKIEIMKWTQLDIQILEQKVKQLEQIKNDKNK